MGWKDLMQPEAGTAELDAGVNFLEELLARAEAVQWHMDNVVSPRTAQEAHTCSVFCEYKAGCPEITLIGETWTMPLGDFLGYSRFILVADRLRVIVASKGTDYIPERWRKLFPDQYAALWDEYAALCVKYEKLLNGHPWLGLTRPEEPAPPVQETS